MTKETESRPNIDIMYNSLKQSSNKRCTKYYLLRCFSKTRESSPNLNTEKVVFRTFLEKYKRADGKYDFSSFGHLKREKMFDRIFKYFMRLHSSGGIIRP